MQKKSLLIIILTLFVFFFVSIIVANNSKSSNSIRETVEETPATFEMSDDEINQINNNGDIQPKESPEYSKNGSTLEVDRWPCTYSYKIVSWKVFDSWEDAGIIETDLCSYVPEVENGGGVLLVEIEMDNVGSTSDEGYYTATEFSLITQENLDAAYIGPDSYGDDFFIMRMREKVFIFTMMV